jgi:hypothetical protein
MSERKADRGVITWGSIVLTYWTVGLLASLGACLFVGQYCALLTLCGFTVLAFLVDLIRRGKI